MSREIVPIASLGSRPPTHGRIRFGVFDGRPKSIKTFRFTSDDTTALEQIADLYGGRVEKWSNPKAAPGQSEVITEAREIKVFLPPDPLSVHYEQWAAGGCQRRCDGVTCSLAQRTGDDYEMTDVDCLCVASNQMACKPTSRLNVLLPGVRFGGVWMLQSAGWTVAQEMPAMVALIQGMQARGIVAAFLTLKEDQAQGGSKKFIVPKLRMDDAPEALAAAAARGIAIDAPAAPAIGPAPFNGIPESAIHRDADVLTEATFTYDDEVIDAELVDDDLEELADRAAEAPSATALILAGPDLLSGVLVNADGDVDEARRLLEGIVAGKAEIKSVLDDGSLKLVKAKAA